MFTSKRYNQSIIIISLALYLFESSFESSFIDQLKFILVLLISLLFFGPLQTFLRGPHSENVIQEILNILWISFFFFSFVKKLFLTVIITLRCLQVHRLEILISFFIHIHTNFFCHLLSQILIYAGIWSVKHNFLKKVSFKQIFT